MRPTLGWRNVAIVEPLNAATGLPVHIENSGRAARCAVMDDARQKRPARARRSRVRQRLGWPWRRRRRPRRSTARAQQHRGRVRPRAAALDGPRCACGATGCWEAYVSNRATIARYFNRSGGTVGSDPAGAAGVHHRGPDFARAQRRREGRRGAAGHGALPGTRAREHRPCSRPRPASTSAERSLPPGI